ncbi:MAG: ATP-binding protein [Clostridia bacterium]|nr:ATP-binding protein [Clostridia bacterium]
MDKCLRDFTEESPDAILELYQDLINLSKNGVVVSDCETNEIYFANQTANAFLTEIGTRLFDDNPSSGPIRIKNDYYQVHTYPIDWMGRRSIAKLLVNISEEVALRKQLTSDEERYRTMVELSHIAFIDYDTRKGTVYFNDLFKPYDVLGENFSDFFDGHKCFSTIHPDDKEKLQSFFREIEATGMGTADPIRLKLLDGSYRWSEMHGIDMLDAAGNIIRKICFIQDVDDVVRQYLELKAQYDFEIEKQNDLEGNVVEKILIDLTDNKVIHATRSMGNQGGDIIGLTVEQLLELRLSHTRDKTERAALRRFMDREALLRAYHRMEHPELEMKAALPGGIGKTYFSTGVQEVKNPENDHIIAVLVTKNVDKERTEELLMRRLLQTNYAGVLLVHAQTGKIKMGYSGKSERFVMDYGKTYDELIREIIRQVVLPESREAVLLETSLASIRENLASASRCSGRMTIMQDGEQTFSVWTAAYFDEEREFILFTSADVTNVHRKDLENNMKLAQALKNAEVASKAKSTFLARMSHEIRTPITTVSGILELIREDCIKKRLDKETLLKRTDMASAANQYLLTLINDILDFSKMENNALTITTAPVHLESLAAPVYAMAIPLAEKKNIHFIRERKTHIGECFKMDAVRVAQVLMNLLNNAIKFTPEGGTVKFTGEIEKVEGNTATAKFVVSDTGVGISSEFMADVFEPFKQEYAGSKSKYGGTGLGLSISRGLARLMGGDITVESEKGKGATFVATMRWEIAEERNKEISFGDADMRMDGINILLCEDNQINRMIADKLLTNQGCAVITANNGREGLELFANSGIGAIDCVLMDIRMPLMDGLEAARAIRSLDRTDAKTVPIIAMSANAYDEDKHLSIASGMNEHLSKPVDPKVLYHTILKYMADKG